MNILNLTKISKRLNIQSLSKVPTPTNLILRNSINKSILFHSNNDNSISINYSTTTTTTTKTKRKDNPIDKNGKRIGTIKKPIFKTYSERHEPKIKNDFKEFGFSDGILQSIKENNWEKPTDVQKQVIPMIFKGRNIVFSSVTGSGKTGAYLLPFIQILTTFKRNKLNYLKKQKQDKENGTIENEFDENYELFNEEDYGDQQYDQKIQNNKFKEQKQVFEEEEYEEEEYQEEEEEEVYEEVEYEEEEEQVGKEKEKEKQIELDDNDDEFKEFDEYYKKKQGDDKESMKFYEKLERMKKLKIKKPFNEIDPIGLILLPSKELVTQVSNEINQLVKNVTIEESTIEGGDRVRVLSLMGGINEAKQIKTLKSGVDIIIGTPGRIYQLINQDVLSLQQVRMTIIDEFDKLFNLGFFPDIKDIFQYLPQIRSRTKPFSMQTVLTSATLTHRMDNLITRFAPNHLIANLNEEMSAPSSVKQYFYYVNYRQKTHLLIYFLRRGGKTSLKQKKTLVFARTQQRVENTKKMLLSAFKDINAFSIHADMSLAQRNEILTQFKEAPIGETNILICTDVLTRGVHIDGLDAVVNLDVPHVSEDYLHRIGRVGRNGIDGFSLTFVSPDRLIFKVGERTVGLDEGHLIQAIEKSTGVVGRFSKIPGPWRGLGEGKHQTGQGSIIVPRNQQQQQPQKDDEIYEDLLEDEDDFNGIGNFKDLSNQFPKTSGPKFFNREEVYQNKIEKKAVAELLVKKKILETFKGPPTKDGLPRVKFNPNVKSRESKVSKIVVDRKGEIHDLPRLTDFKEGQYHQVLDDFDRKRALKRGVGLPEKKTRIFLPSKIETKRSINNIKKYATRFEKRDN
ncbi:hypothetical protein ACTFIU_006070 [Dictyostelium citrinum]